MRKNYLTYVLVLIAIQYSVAQKEASRWYFGEKAGLDFNSGAPVADLSGSLDTLEGCASISDTDGNLLFYTDGTTVWNREHAVMPTGNGLFGNPSSTQSAIIVPKPGDKTTYYIFTVDWSGGDNGLNYYTVDMKLSRGLGDVVGQANIPTATKLIGAPATEKIAAVKVFNKDAFWVISSKRGRFFIFKVDQNGVDPNTIPGNTGFTEDADSRGYLKVSPDGTKIVSANMTSGTFVYDFDAINGVVSNERQLDLEDKLGYGVAFSPLGRKLYISTGNIGNILVEERLYQFSIDLSNPTTTSINATRVLLHTYLNRRAALQLAIDGKIYRAINKSSFLGVIHDPDEDGLAANYEHEAISLGDRLSKEGLPPFIQSFFVAIVEIENTCEGLETLFSINADEPIVSIRIDFGDGSPAITTTNPTTTYTYSNPGEYTVNVQITTADEVKNITQVITVFPRPNVPSSIVLQQCDDNQDGLSQFNLTEIETSLSSDIPTPTFSYHFNLTDAETNSNRVENVLDFSNSTASQLFVRVENEFGCYGITSLDLEVSTTQIPSNFMLNFVSCDTDGIDNDGVTNFDFSSATTSVLNLFPSNQNLSVQYYESITEALAEENALDPTDYRNESSPFSQNIVIRVEDVNTNNACIGLGFYINLRAANLPQFELPETAYLCSDQTNPTTQLAISNPEEVYSYEWRNQNGDILNSGSTASISVSELGLYTVTATSNDNCIITKTIQVASSSIATIQNIDVIDDSDNNSITIIVSGIGNYEYALNNADGPYQDSNVFNNIEAGSYVVFIRDKNGCGTQSQKVFVVGYPRFFTPNNDGFNDTWQVQGGASLPNAVVTIFDRFGKVLTQFDTNSEGWNGVYRGRMMPASDYWFRAELEDGQVRKGHFSLIKK